MGTCEINQGRGGAVSLIMQMIVNRDYGFELEYESSGRYDEWTNTDEGLLWVQHGPR